MSTRLPNFLIVGAAKSGTTSAYRYLRQHPQIYMPDHKEPLFMVSEIYEKLSTNDPRHHISEEHTVFTLDNYKNLFKDANNEIAIGEASTPYLYYHEASIPKIKKHLGDVKIIIFLRNPVDRAFSAYKHFVKQTADTDSFEQFLEKEEARIRDNWDILTRPKDLGFYNKQVKAFKNIFSRVKIFLLDDLKTEPDKTVKDIYNFLEVDPSFSPDTKMEHNKSAPPGNRLLHSFLTRNNILKDIARPLVRIMLPAGGTAKLTAYLKTKNKKNIQPKTRKYLMELYRDDILNLQGLTGRDLSGWIR